ncbi:MAG: cupin domain-containing protein [Melioribacter sp.]|nr:cupin domain-containing protein [Melioribacter sp.]
MKYQSEFFIETNNIDWHEPAPGLKRKFMGYNNDIMMVQIHFEKGAIGALHKHPHSQTTYVASGKFEVTIDNEKKALHTNDGFFVPPDIEHSVLCLEEGILVDTFSPIREDFVSAIPDHKI